MESIIVYIYLYYFIGILIILFNYDYSQYPKLYGIYISLILFFTLKWIFNYNKCTLSYIEYKLCGSDKTKCIIYNFLETMMNVRYCQDIHIFYIFSGILIVDYFYIKKNKITKII